MMEVLDSFLDSAAVMVADCEDFLIAILNLIVTWTET
jgi:hypothetical protein